MWLDLEAMLGRGGSEPRPAPPEAYDQAQRNAELARRRAELQGRITAEISADAPIEFKWFALVVTPGQESIAAAHLVARRFGIYTPAIDEMVIEHGRWRLRRQQLLPGYIFISSLGLTGRWRRAKNCPGVAGFLNRAGTENPAPIPEAFIDELRAYEDAENARFDRVHGRAFDRPKAKRKNRSAERRARERVKKRLKAQRRRARSRLP